MKVLITKYALTQGVLVREAEVCKSVEDGSMIAVREPRGYISHYHKPDWHTSQEESNARVLQMVEAKIKSLEKSLNKMRKLYEEYR